MVGDLHCYKDFTPTGLMIKTSKNLIKTKRYVKKTLFSYQIQCLCKGNEKIFTYKTSVRIANSHLALKETLKKVSIKTD